MKITFRGWARESFVHNHEVSPAIPAAGYSYRPEVGQPGAPLQWESASKARGRVNRLGLNGDFLIELELNPEELRSWLSAYVEERPADALKLLSEFKAEALIRLLQKSTTTRTGTDAA
ncbi:hypothetical protein [Pseudoxanthomonas mexicana]|uniref:hypothetical protein n=1 Tax=Pseudoxanthomonas mexicana TaxID=128785 RepID=UPI0022F3B515|nr:hypothetical protein [Pseudoxanthomonas mexicana]WBX95220.1 hypothetical protein PE064_08585 [Pseudoxanthomonas mexicana]